MTLRSRKLPTGFWKGSTRSRRAAKSARAVKSLAPRARKAVATIARRVFSKKTETKYVAQLLSTDPTDIYAATLPTGGNPQLFDCMPQLSIGPAEYQRDGVKVMPTRHSVDLDLRFNTRNILPNQGSTQQIETGAWDVQVHVWYGYARRYKNVVDVLGNEVNLLQAHLETGAGANSEWLGGPIDDFMQVNKEVMVLKHKTFRMFRPLGDQNTADGIQQTYFPQVIRKHLRLSFKPPKTLLYNENVGIPDNYAPFVIVAYQHSNGSQGANTVYNPASPSVINIPALQMYMKSHLWFKDA